MTGSTAAIFIAAAGGMAVAIQAQFMGLMDRSIGNAEAVFITYCGGGIAASADAFALIRLGFEDVAIYAASLEEWTANPENPMEVDLENFGVPND